MENNKIGNNTVTISEKEYIDLLYSDLQLNYLENCGVDNWSEYSRPISRSEVKDLIKNLKQKYNFKIDDISKVFDLLCDYIYKDDDDFDYEDNNDEIDEYEDIDLYDLVLKNFSKGK